MKNILLLSLILLFSCEDYGNPLVVEIEGCTDPYSPNYNSSANIDDESCQYSFTFSDDINTIFAQSGCYDCHNGQNQFNLEN